MYKILSSFLTGLLAAFLFIILYPKVKVWAYVITAIALPIIFWACQMMVDLMRKK